VSREQKIIGRTVRVQRGRHWWKINTNNLPGSGRGRHYSSAESVQGEHSNVRDPAMKTFMNHVLSSSSALALAIQSYALGPMKQSLQAVVICNSSVKNKKYSTMAETMPSEICR